MPAERGVVYVATGEPRDVEVFRSVQSLRIHHPGLPVTLFTDLNVRDDDFDEVHVIAEPRRDWSDKVAPLVESPYERTIFLATDTYICGSLDPIFRLLDRFEMAVAHDPQRGGSPSLANLPPTFPELDTGVLAFQHTESVRAALEEWILLADALRESGDDPAVHYQQQAFRQLVWDHTIRLAVLPPEYNLRITRPGALGANSRAVILRGDSDHLERAAQLVNRSLEVRAVLPTLEHLDATHTVVLSRQGNRVARVLGWVWRLLGRRAGRTRH